MNVSHCAIEPSPGIEIEQSSISAGILKSTDHDAKPD